MGRSSCRGSHWRRDANEPEIIDRLKATCVVIPIEAPAVGDLLVAFKRPKSKVRELGLIEVKGATTKISDDQLQFGKSARKLGMPYAVVRTPDEAEEAVALWRKGKRHAPQEED